MNGDLRAAYHRALAAHIDALRRLARRHHMRHLRVDAATTMERALVDYLSLPAEAGR